MGVRLLELCLRVRNGWLVNIRIMFRGLFAKEEKVLEGVEGNGKSAFSDDVWAPADMLYEPPLLEVTQPKGSFCTIHTRFAAALDPDGVYDIVTDPNNYRVFRNIKVSPTPLMCKCHLNAQ